MNTTLRIFAVLLTTLALAACNRQGPDIPKPVGSGEQDADGDRDGVQTVMVSANAGKVGAAVSEQGEIVEPRTSFASGEVVYVSVPANGKRRGDRIHVYWFHEDGKSRKEEAKPVAGPFVAFDYTPTETGRYSIEIDVNERPIGLVDFDVK